MHGALEQSECFKLVYGAHRLQVYRHKPYYQRNDEKRYFFDDKPPREPAPLKIVNKQENQWKWDSHGFGEARKNKKQERNAQFPRFFIFQVFQAGNRPCQEEETLQDIFPLRNPCHRFDMHRMNGK